MHEYYAGTEGNGFCIINSQEWLAHKGSVGHGGLMAEAVKIVAGRGRQCPRRRAAKAWFY